MKTLIFIAGVLFANMVHAQSYPLTCKFDGSEGASWRPHPLHPSKIIIIKKFRHSDRPASEGVPPGHCAWNDRGMRASEPTLVGHEMTNVMSLREVKHNGQSHYIPAPVPWVAVSAFAGREVVFKVQTGQLYGITEPVLIIENF